MFRVILSTYDINNTNGKIPLVMLHLGHSIETII